MTTFGRILVPLDGSHLAEAILPSAEALARRLGSVLVLVHAVEEDPPAAVHGEPHLASRAGAQAYLEHQREHYLQKGLEVEIHVSGPQEEDVAEAIERLAANLDIDLVAMCAHGRLTLRDRVIGPIAQRVLRGGRTPIMMRTSGASAEHTVELRRILFPVDFRHDLGAATNAVVALARESEAVVTLLHAVDLRPSGLPARMLPNTTAAVAELERDAARPRLAELAASLRGRDVSTEIRLSAEPADEAILGCARTLEPDLIVLVTHGRSGIVAWYERSIGRRMIEEPGLTLLLLREV
ncbi:MAG: universal stress protein [Actinobacteria bacterium]|nr:universal stress protein [Actinomycetota bacterium]